MEFHYIVTQCLITLLSKNR